MKYWFALSHLGLIKVTGPDAKTFLQGQLTCDVDKLAPGKTLLGAYCNAQGRIIAIFYITQVDDDLFMCLPREIVQSTLDIINKYAVFSKLELIDVSDDYLGIGIVGEEVDVAIKFTVADELHRTVCFIPKDQLLDLSHLEQQAIDVWKQFDIAAGIPSVFVQTQESFLPHRLNLQLINGIDFDKGCYVGQEIIARMHYRGKLKHHMYRVCFESDTQPNPGEPIPLAEGAIGVIVDSVKTDSGKIETLVVLQSSEIEQTGLEILQLPYDL